jgi:hypothetical protein
MDGVALDKPKTSARPITIDETVLINFLPRGAISVVPPLNLRSLELKRQLPERF